MGLDLLPAFIREHYEVHEWKHACAILRHDFPSEWQDLCDLLTQFRLRKSWITVGGGRKTQVSDHIDRFLYERGWQEKQFLTQIKVDAATRDAPTHKVDCFKNRVAIEIEWNNKDPFFDRDLNNFRLLLELRAISVGVIITRTDALQGISTGWAGAPATALPPPTWPSCCRASKAAAVAVARCWRLVSPPSFTWRTLREFHTHPFLCR